MKVKKIILKNGFQPYPEYKDSGIEWIGKIPKDWEGKKISSVFEFPKEKVSDEDYEPLSVTYGGIKKQVETAAKSDDGTNRKRVLKGDIAINGRSDRKGAAGVSEYDGSISLVYHVLRKRAEDIDTRFFHYLFRSEVFSEEFYRWGRGIVDDLWTTRSDEMKRIGIPVPSFETQQKIAAYLDEKTALIDRIIEKKKKLAELLRERRTAIINQAVTRGLDPDAELVDSGIEWIGKIPRGWEGEKLKYVAHMNSKTLSDSTPSDFSFKYHDISSVDEEETHDIDEEITFEKAPSRARRIVSSGDSIIATVRTYLKAIAYFERVELDTIVSTGFAVLSPTKCLEPKFLFYYLQSDRFINEVIIRSKGVSYPAITPFDLSSLQVMYPNLEKQKLIVSHLDGRVSVINSLLKTMDDSITHLQEFQSSLISNVVTGKVKV